MEHKSIKTPFLPLIWRELQLCSKKLYINIVFTAVLSIIGILFPLSFKYGNLKLIFVEISSASLWQYMHYGIIAYIGYMFSAFSFVASESVIEDTKKKWVLFLKSTPVPPCKLAMAKYVFKFVMIAFQLLLSFVYAAIISFFCSKAPQTSKSSVLSQKLSQSGKTTADQIICLDDFLLSFMDIAVHRHLNICMSRNSL